MAIARISAQDTTATGTTSAAASYPAIPQANNLLIAVVTNDVTNTTSVTGFTSAIGVANTGSTTIFYKIAKGTEGTITATKATATVMRMAMYEYGGFAGTPFLDKTASGTSTAVTIPTGTTATTTAPDELVIAGAGIQANNTLSSWSNSFVTVTSQSLATASQFIAQLITTGAATYTTTATTTATSAVNHGVIATFRSLPQQLNNYQFVKVGNGMSSSEKIR